jgi:hypothetical protein
MQLRLQVATVPEPNPFTASTTMALMARIQQASTNPSRDTQRFHESERTGFQLFTSDKLVQESEHSGTEGRKQNVNGGSGHTQKLLLLLLLTL